MKYHNIINKVSPLDLTGLNEVQRRAVTHGEGPLLLLAGPGSGKTFTITNRILYLLENGAAPEQLLVITFTKEAALSMQRRFQERCGSTVYPVNFGTFHSCFYHILQQSGAVRAKKIINNSEKITLLLPILRQYLDQGGAMQYRETLYHNEAWQQSAASRHNEAWQQSAASRHNEAWQQSAASRHNAALQHLEKGGRDSLKDDAVQLLSAVSFYKNTLKYEAALKKIPSMWQPHFGAVMTAYGERVRKEGYIDFDDMLSECCRLLQENAEIRSYWQERFSHILIDEFQDINPVQYRTVKLLTKSPCNIFAVGDDDQAIYGFRGAEPDCLRRFEKEFRAERLLLDINYRSRSEIVQASLAVIGENRNRFEKKLRAAQEAGGQLQKTGSQETGGQLQKTGSQETGGQLQKTGSQETGGQSQKTGGQLQKTGSQEVGGQSQKTGGQLQKGGHTPDGTVRQSVACVGFVGREEQYRHMLDALEYASDKGESCAVLFRTNSYMQGFAARLGREGITYEIREAAVSIYEHFIVKDIAAYLAVACGSARKEDFLRIVNKPSRYVSREAVAECGMDIAGLKAYYGSGSSLSPVHRAAVMNGLTAFERQLKNMGRLPLHLAVDFCLKAAGYERYLKETAAAREDKWQEWQELLEWLKGDVEQYADLEEWLAAQKAYNRALAQGGISAKQTVGRQGNVGRQDNIGRADNVGRADNAGRQDNVGRADNAGRADNVEKAGIADKRKPVQLMTVHAAKGLEFDRVWIPDCNEKIYPHGSLPDAAAVEEERRILYVAMTRAKKGLELLYLTGTREHPRQISRFLNPLFTGVQ